MGKITSIHDTFIRAIMADKSIAIEYFQNYLPSFVASQLDFSTLTQLPDVYVSAELQKTMSDIVYSCQRKDGKGEIKVSLLIEHKSYPDKYTPIQIGGYIFSGLLKQIQNGKEPSLIIPVLLYHGKGKWGYQTLAELFQNLDAQWKQFIPDFDYIYNNLGEIPDEEVEALNNKFLVASLLALKHSFEKEWLLRNAERILILAEYAPQNLQSGLIVYLFGRSKLDEEKILEILETLPSTLKDTVMNTLDIFVEKGKKIGVEIGRQEGVEIGMTKKEYEKNLAFTQSLLKETVFDDTKIAQLVGVTEDFVSHIRIEMNSRK